MSTLSDRFAHLSNDRLNLEPSFRGYQLIGDSQFLRFAEQLLGQDRKKSNGLAYLGLCVSGQKAYNLLQRIKDNFYPTSKKVILMIGTNDLLQNTSSSEMCDHIEEIVLELVRKGVHRVIVLTIPPVPRLKKEKKHWERLETYNEHIKETFSNRKEMLVIDICPYFLKSDCTRNSGSLNNSLSSSRNSLASNSPGNSTSASRRNSAASTLSQNFPISALTTPSQIKTNLRISVDSCTYQASGQKRKIYLLEEEDMRKRNDGYGGSPVVKRRSVGSASSLADDDHNDVYYEDAESDLEGDSIKMDYFELYFGNSNSMNKRKDLIHLNGKGLRLIRNLLIKTLDES